MMLYSIPNGRGKKDFPNILDFKVVTFKYSINMFECMYIAESVYEDALETYYKQQIGKIIASLVTSGISG